MEFKIKSPTFEGPLDLLLQLIEKEELDITTFSLAKVTNDFLQHVKHLKSVDTNSLAEFLDISSRLILIKSKILLPQLSLTEEEEEDIKELERRLEEYQVFKKITKELKKLSDSDERGFERRSQCPIEITLFDPPKSVDKNLLFDLFKKTLRKNREETRDLRKMMVEPVVSIEDKIDEINKKLSIRDNVKFSKFLKKAKTKTEIIVSFLAILELLKFKKISFSQDKNFSDIIITANADSKKIKK